MPKDELLSSLEVLVVDDDPAARELIIEYFNVRAIRVEGAHDGRAAITSLQRSRGRFGLVVTDLNLPGADGFAVLQAARQANAECYVVIVTGYASLDSAIRAVRVGAYDYLTKPFALGQLDIILSRIQDRSALQRENRQLMERPAPFNRPVMPPSRELPQTPDLAHRLTAVEAAIGRMEQLLRQRG